ncbi:MAG: type II toxin-antitoxin system Phd/YefM family antitoxin [Thermodesulfobacteriota bacterium]
MVVSASRLRSNIYKLLDKVLESGRPLEIERKGRKLKIVPVAPPDKLEGLSRHEGYLSGDPEEIVHLDWSGEWRP